MGPYCSDCGGFLDVIPDKYFKEGAVWYKCPNCQTEWEYDYGGVIAHHDGPRIRRLGKREERI